MRRRSASSKATLSRKARRRHRIGRCRPARDRRIRGRSGSRRAGGSARRCRAARASGRGRRAAAACGVRRDRTRRRTRRSTTGQSRPGPRRGGLRRHRTGYGGRGRRRRARRAAAQCARRSGSAGSTPGAPLPGNGFGRSASLLLERRDRPLELVGIDHRNRRAAERAGRVLAHVDRGAATGALHALDVPAQLGDLGRREIADEVLGAKERAEGHVAAVPGRAPEGLEGGGALLVELAGQEGLAARTGLAGAERPVGLGHRLAHLLEQRQRRAGRELVALHAVEPDAVAPGTEIEGHPTAVMAVEGGLAHAAAAGRAGHAAEYKPLAAHVCVAGETP